jgi:hypothetical protein
MAARSFREPLFCGSFNFTNREDAKRIRRTRPLERHARANDHAVALGRVAFRLCNPFRDPNHFGRVCGVRRNDAMQTPREIQAPRGFLHRG